MKRRLLEREVLLLRSADESQAPVAEGYASVFFNEADPGTEYVWGRVHERIAPTAFDRALEEGQDVVAKFNHDSNHVLGRRSRGTLRLSKDDVGLKYSIDLPDTQTGRDLAVSLERGDVKSSSFAFELVSQETEYRDGNVYLTITDVNLGDVGPVVSPAYEAAISELRNDADFKQYELNAIHVERDRRQRRVRAIDIAEEVVEN